MLPVEAAHVYVERFGWPVFPRPDGRYIGHGKNDATTDLALIDEWWRRFPRALVCTPTGVASGLVVLDIDRKHGVNGFDTLEAKGISALPDTPLVHTPHGGMHVYFRRNPGFVIGSSTGKHGLGDGLDVKGEGGSITLPTPGSGYAWDKSCNFRTVQLKLAPTWLGHRAHKDYVAGGFHLAPQEILVRACSLIRLARSGDRHAVLNRQAFLVGLLVGRRILDEGLARHELEAAVLVMCVSSGGNQRKALADLAAAFAAGLRAKGR